MDRSTAERLWNELLRCESLEEYLERYGAQFEKEDFFQMLNRIFEHKNMNKATLAARAGVSGVYVYQIFGRQRMPSREKLIAICVGMGAEVGECQNLLNAAGMALLCPGVRRETVILFGLLHGWPLEQLNETLYEKGEKTLD